MNMENKNLIVTSNWIQPSSIEQGLKLAELMAISNLLPDHLKKDVGACLRVIEQASRWGMSPFAVADCTSLVHGRLMFEGKLVAAALKSMNAIEGRLKYEITGTGQDAKITITGFPRGEKEPCVITGSVKQWRTFGKDKAGNPIPNAWDKQPEDQLIYRGTRQWARRYTPEALLGVYTPDEFADENVVDITPHQDPKPKPEAAPVNGRMEKVKRMFDLSAKAGENRDAMKARVLELTGKSVSDTKSLSDADLDLIIAAYLEVKS